jgi:HK97 family phage prohead protease
MPEYKTSPQYIKSVQGRVVTGVFAVHGNVDGGQDRSFPGAFAKTFAEGLRRIKFLWMHDMWAPPTAVIKSLRELTREELPAEVLAKAPDATGGAEVAREYLTTERGDEILTGLVAGAINEMSYGYDPIKFDFEATPDGKQVRNLRELKLYDVSDVTFGMNPATVGSKFQMPAELLFQQLEAFAAEIKAGRRNNGDDQGRIDMLHNLAVELGAGNCAGILEPDTGKSRAAPSGTHSDTVDVARLFAEFQRNTARLNGVAI